MMTSQRTGSFIAAMLLSTTLWADATYYAPGAADWLAQLESAPQPAMPKKPIQITGINAEGRKQGAYVDQNGNLKIAETEAPQDAIPDANTATAATEQSAQQQDDPSKQIQPLPHQPNRGGMAPEQKAELLPDSSDLQPAKPKSEPSNLPSSSSDQSHAVGNSVPTAIAPQANPVQSMPPVTTPEQGNSPSSIPAQPMQEETMHISSANTQINVN